MIEGPYLPFCDSAGAARGTGTSPRACIPIRLAPASTELAPAASAASANVPTTISARRLASARRRAANGFIPRVLSFVDGVIGGVVFPAPFRHWQADPEGGFGRQSEARPIRTQALWPPRPI